MTSVRGVRSFAALVGIVVLGFVVASVPAPQRASAEGSLPNPAYPDRCGLDVALVIDTSMSITAPDQGGSPANPSLMTLAASQFVEALAGTPSSVAVSSFRTVARSEIGLTSVRAGSGAHAVTAAIAGIDFSTSHPAEFPAGRPWPTPAAQALLGDRYGTLGGTNWEDAIASAAGADVIVLITDGNPTTRAGDDDPGYVPGEPEDLAAGVAAANARKAAGTRIVAVGIGGAGNLAQLNVENLRLVSGPAANEDYYLTGFDGLASTLRSIATRLCAPSVSVVKYVETPSGSLVPAAGWDFSVALTPVPADPPPTAVTDAGGAASFKWTASGATTVTVTEGSRDGYRLDPVECRDRSGAPIPVGAVTSGATLVVGLDEIATCVFVNRLEPASLEVVKTALTDVARPGDTVTYRYAITNTGDTVVSGLSIVDDVLGAVTPQKRTLQPGETTTAIAAYAVPTTALPGPVVNLATVTGTTPDGRTIRATDTASVPLAGLSVAKTADLSVAAVGDRVTYTYVVTNTGSVALRGAGLTDDRLGALTLSASTIPPGGSVGATRTHVVTASEIGASIVNTALATATATSGDTGATVGVTGTDSASVGTVGIALAKSADRAAASVGETITYRYTVTNLGSVPLQGIVLVDDVLGTIDLASTTLAAGATIVGTATHTVTPADGTSSIVNTAKVTGSATADGGGNGRDVSATATATVAIVPGGGTTTTTSTTTTTTSTTTTTTSTTTTPGTSSTTTPTTPAGGNGTTTPTVLGPTEPATTSSTTGTGGDGGSPAVTTAAVAASDDALPRTGTGSEGLTALAAGLLLLGANLLVATRRRRPAR